MEPNNEDKIVADDLKVCERERAEYLFNLAKQLKDTKNITLEITPELAQRVAELGYDPTFGARPIRRLIQDKIEDGIAKLIIEGTAKNGDTIPAATLLQFLG